MDSAESVPPKRCQAGEERGFIRGVVGGGSVGSGGEAKKLEEVAAADAEMFRANADSGSGSRRMLPSPSLVRLSHRLAGCLQERFALHHRNLSLSWSARKSIRSRCNVQCIAASPMLCEQAGSSTRCSS